MTQNTQTEVKIRHWAAWLRRLTLALAILSPLVFLFLLWFHMLALSSMVPLPNQTHLDLGHLSSLGWAVVVMLAVLPALGFAPVLWCLYQLFRAYEQGEVFSLHNSRLIKWCSLWLIAIDALRIVQGMLAGPLLTLAHVTPPFFLLRLGISYSLIGLFIYLIAKIMELAQSLKEEQDLTI